MVDTRERIISEARARQDRVYRLDPPPSASDNTIDCSLLVLEVAAAAGVPLPPRVRTSGSRRSSRATIRTRRRAEKLVHRPPCLQTIPDRGGTQPGLFGPPSERQGSPAIGQVDVLAGVSHLLGGSCPSAIPGSIRPVIVDPVEAVLRRRARPHIGVEPLETVPLRDYIDPAPPVLRVALNMRVTAPPEHTRPDRVFRRPSRGTAILRSIGVPLSRCFLAQTAARLRMARTKLDPVYGKGRAAIAPDAVSNNPSGSSDGIFTQNSQAAETFAGSMGDTITGHLDSPPGVAPPAAATARGFLHGEFYHV